MIEITAETFEYLVHKLLSDNDGLEKRVLALEEEVKKLNERLT